jgi:hypothetical protein
LPVAGYRLPVIISLPPATGNWQLATGNWQLATGNRQLATGNWQLATGNRSPRAVRGCRLRPRESLV